MQKTFDIDEEKEKFEIEENSKSYENLDKRLCAICAIDAVESLEEDIYFEYCERCGKKYDFIKAECEFENMHTDDYSTYTTISDMTNELLCSECAIDEYNNKN